MSSITQRSPNENVPENAVVTFIKYKGTEYAFGFDIEDYKKNRGILDHLKRMTETDLDRLILGISIEELAEVPPNERPGAEYNVS